MEIELIQGGVYLTRLNPAKKGEIAKVGPAVVLTTDFFLPHVPVVFVCPLSSQSDVEVAALHVELPARDRLLKTSYALVEHCRSISRHRMVPTRLATLTEQELHSILNRLYLMTELAD